MTQDLYIVAANKIVDQQGSLTEFLSVFQKSQDSKLKIKEFHIAPFSMGWHAPLPKDYFKSACSPLKALRKAQELISEQQADLVVVRGRDHIKTEYKNNKAARNKLMTVYGETTILQAYDQVAEAFLKEFEISDKEFERVRDLLFENYWRTWKQKHPQAQRPQDQWFQNISKNFRGVDCANPNVDFEGALLVCSKDVADKLGIPEEKRVKVAGLSLVERCEDGLELIPQFIDYNHMTEAYDQACQQAEVDFPTLFRSSKALLEVYTCYPHVPMAFLLKTGLVKNVSEFTEFLEKYLVTYSGGLNLNKAPWNNTTLSALIDAFEILQEGKSSTMGIHSNGAIGNYQGFLILTRE